MHGTAKPKNKPLATPKLNIVAVKRVCHGLGEAARCQPRARSILRRGGSLGRDEESEDPDQDRARPRQGLRPPRLPALIKEYVAINGRLLVVTGRGGDECFSPSTLAGEAKNSLAGDASVGDGLLEQRIHRLRNTLGRADLEV